MQFRWFSILFGLVVTAGCSSSNSDDPAPVVNDATPLVASPSGEDRPQTDVDPAPETVEPTTGDDTDGLTADDDTGTDAGTDTGTALLRFSNAGRNPASVITFIAAFQPGTENGDSMAVEIGPQQQLELETEVCDQEAMIIAEGSDGRSFFGSEDDPFDRNEPFTVQPVCGDTLELTIDTDSTPPLAETGEIIIRNHGLEAFITRINVVSRDDPDPDFDANLLVEPVEPGSSRSIVSDLCGGSVDWIVTSGDVFVFDRFNVPFTCGQQLDVFVNPDPSVASPSDRGTLVFTNNATEAVNVLTDVQLRRSGVDGAEFGPGRLADDEDLGVERPEGFFDVSPCDIEYDIRLLGLNNSVITVLDEAFIQCEFETNVELIDADF